MREEEKLILSIAKDYIEINQSINKMKKKSELIKEIIHKYMNKKQIYKNIRGDFLEIVRDNNEIEIKEIK